MNLGSLDPALGCSGLMSILSYDSHRVTRAARITETGDCGDTEDNNRYRVPRTTNSVNILCIPKFIYLPSVVTIIFSCVFCPLTSSSLMITSIFPSSVLLPDYVCLSVLDVATRPVHPCWIGEYIFKCYFFFIVQAHERVSLIVKEKEFITSYFQLHKRENGSGNC